MPVEIYFPEPRKDINNLMKVHKSLINTSKLIFITTLWSNRSDDPLSSYRFVV